MRRGKAITWSTFRLQGLCVNAAICLFSEWRFFERVFFVLSILVGLSSWCFYCCRSRNASDVTKFWCGVRKKNEVAIRGRVFCEKYDYEVRYLKRKFFVLVTYMFITLINMTVVDHFEASTALRLVHLLNFFAVNFTVLKIQLI